MKRKLTVAPPLFYADDSEARVAGRLVESQHAGLVIKKTSRWTSIYSSAMPLGPALMRNIIRSAGVHIWLDSDDARYTDGQYVGIHAATEGDKLLHLPADFDVIDVLSGQRLGTHVRVVSVAMKRAERVLLQLGSDLIQQPQNTGTMQKLFRVLRVIPGFSFAFAVGCPRHCRCPKRR